MTEAWLAVGRRFGEVGGRRKRSQIEVLKSLFEVGDTHLFSTLLPHRPELQRLSECDAEPRFSQAISGERRQQLSEKQRSLNPSPAESHRDAVGCIRWWKEREETVGW